MVPSRAVRSFVRTADRLNGVSQTSGDPKPTASSAASDAGRADSSVLVATPCPRCGTSSTVQGRHRSWGSAEQHCVSCGYAWRWLAPGSDAFSLILADKVHATAPVEDEHEPRRGVFRASRFPVRLPLRYGVVGSREWDVGVTENISRSGILFYAEPSGALVQALASKPVLDIMFELPHDGADGLPQQVHCKGRVARAVWSEGRAYPSAWAITVGDYILQAY